MGKVRINFVNQYKGFIIQYRNHLVLKNITLYLHSNCKMDQL